MNFHSTKLAVYEMKKIYESTINEIRSSFLSFSCRKILKKKECTPSMHNSNPKIKTVNRGPKAFNPGICQTKFIFQYTRNMGSSVFHFKPIVSTSITSATLYQLLPSPQPNISIPRDI